MVAAVLALVVAGVAPFALRERVTSGAVADTASRLTGPVQEVTNSLRALGYACSDRAHEPGTVLRSCSRVRMMSRSRVQLVVVPGTGAIDFVRTSVDQGSASGVAHQRVLTVVADAVDLTPDSRSQVLAAATGEQSQSLKLGWGTAVVRTDASDLRRDAGGNRGVGPTASRATLDVSVDALAAAAAANGYVCMTPQVRTIRSCQRSYGGYHYGLWMQGTDSYVTSLDLEVSSTYRTQTRSHWVQAMTQALGWVDTGQGRRLSAWLRSSGDAPGAEGYVDGLAVSFLVRSGEWGKETLGGVFAECGRSVDDITGCEP